jgi:hypothetical protein
MFVLLARKASIAVILRRGPTKSWHVTLWDTKADRFQSGQWFHGSLYPDKCDLSPDGSLLGYFVSKFSGRQMDKGYGYAWTAISRPPYLTALALWPVRGTHGGNAVFVDNYTVLIGGYGPHHPEHPPGPLRVLQSCNLGRNDPLHQAEPCWRAGWEGTLAQREYRRNGLYSSWRKACGKLTLERDGRYKTRWGGTDYEMFPMSGGRRRTMYTLCRAEKPVALFEAHWADWDQQGRLVAAVGGRILEGSLNRRNQLEWRQLASLADEKPERMVAPEWAQRW